MSDSNRAELQYIEETTFNTVPSGPPVLKKFRFTGESLDMQTSSVISNEIRADRQIPDVLRTGISPQGGVNFELSYGSIDDFLVGWAMQSAWPADIALTATMSVDATGNKFESDTATSGVSFATIVVGQWIKTSGFTNSVNNGYFKVLTRTLAGTVHTITVSGATLITEGAGAGRSMKGATLFNGTTSKSFVIEKNYTDINKFDYFSGMRVESFSVDAKANSIITGNFNFKGAGFAASQAATVGDGSPTAAPTGLVMNAIDHVVQLRQGGSLATFDSTGLTISGTNNLREQPAIGSLGPVGIGLGAVNISGSLDVYFEDRTMLDLYRSFTETSLSVRFQDTAGNAYIYDIEGVLFTSGGAPITGQNADVMLTMNFMAKVGGTSGKMLGITRIAA